MKKSKILITLIAVGILVLTQVNTSQAAQNAKSEIVLFGPLTPERTDALLQSSDDPDTTYVQLYPKTLSFLNDYRSPAEPIPINLINPFGKAIYTDIISLENGAGESKLYQGSTPNTLYEINIAVSETELFISVNLTGEILRYTHYQNEIYQVERLHPKDFPAEITPLEANLPAALPIENNSTNSDVGNQIDVMVVYTGAAEAAVGGYAAIQNMISVAVGETNYGYGQSQINHRLNLVHTAAINYAEVNFDWHNALEHLKTNGDGFMDEVHPWRDSYAADIVILLVADTQACGAAWLMNTPSVAFESYAFGVVSTLCATGYYTFGHEIGHILGGHHDRYTTSDPGAFDYSHAYVTPDFSFRTVLAYDCPEGCPRINRYANPMVLYNAQPTGVDYRASDSADNAMTFNNTAWFAANFRDGPPPPAPNNLSTNTIQQNTIGLNWTENSNNEEGFILERSPMGLASWSQIAWLGENTLSYNDNTVAAGLGYDYRLKAWNNNGDSAYTYLYNIITPLYSPEQLSVFAFSQSHIRLGWVDPNAYEDGSQVFRRPHTGGEWALIKTINADIVQVVDNTPECGKAYDYQVQAFNGLTSSVSQTLWNAQTALCDPTGLSGAASSPYSVEITWQDNNETEETTFIEKVNNETGQWQVIVELPPNQTHYTDSGLSCQTTYQYRIRTYNSAGFSSYSTPNLSVQTKECTDYPVTPSEIKGLPLYRGVLLRWQDTDYETSYIIERTPADRNTWEIVATIPANATYYQDTDLAIVETYQYRMKSINPLGESDYSDIVTVQAHALANYIPFVINTSH